MLCTYCHNARLENTTPCANCGAPSPLVEGNIDNYSTLQLPSVQNSWGGPGVSQGPPSDIWNAGREAWGQDQNTTGESWGAGTPLPPSAQQEPSRALVPINAPMYSAGRNMPMPAPAPALAPGSGQSPPAEGDGSIYVAPMYTKPRPIIPRYRAISGLLSVLVVVILLCSGASYYAKASGTFCNLLKKWPGCTSLPQNLKPSPTISLTSPKPSDYVNVTIINSATTTALVDPTTFIARQPTQFFTTNQKFYVTYSVLPHKTPGTLVIKWYTNDQPYRTTSTPTLPSTRDTQNGDTEMTYLQTASGRAELYWQDALGTVQLAIRLYFIVS